MMTISEVFAVLEGQDILCISHHPCCVTCGADEAETEVINTGRAGFVFFTGQDTEYALQHRSLYLAFGGHDMPDEEVGRMAQRAFQDQGMMTSWDGSWETRLRVSMTIDDEEFLQEFVDNDFEDCCADDIQNFRKAQTWARFKRGLTQSMDHRELVEHCFEAWSLLPGGPIVKRAEADFANCITVSQ